MDRGITDLIIALLPGINAKEKIKIIESINNEDELMLVTKGKIEELINKKIRPLWDINELRNRADRIDTVSAKRSIKWVSWTSGEYPPLLREIYDPPAVLFYRGVLPNPGKPLLGMVGTRNPSSEASSQTYKLAYGAGRAGVSVVSGLALGIDAMSHRGNLAGGAPGYAVLGSGVDEVYPSSNRLLAKMILESGGALISEYLPGTRPSKYNFPARNRIISGLSRSVIVTEAPKKSGALITASFALDQGKDLWVASEGVKPGNNYFDRQGTLKLMEDGAEVIYTERDIFDKWNMEVADNESGLNALCTAGKNALVLTMAKFLEVEV